MPAENLTGSTLLNSIHYLDLTEVGELLHSGRMSPVTLVEAMIARIAELNPTYHAYVRVLTETALAEARAAEQAFAQGKILSPIHGVPVAWKDMYWTKGVPTAAGMAIYQDFKPAEDATVISRMRAAGAIMLGQLTMTQAAHAEHHPPFTAPVNPWGDHIWSGASSSGSGVAVATGLCYAALSSETGGSTRIPTAINGITSIKPTWGRISRHGMFELAGSLDHVGVMARSVADVAAMTAAIAGADALDLTAAREPVPDYLAALNGGIKGMRIGLDRDWTYTGIDDQIATALDRAIAVLEDLGAVITPFKMPDSEAMIWDWFGVCAAEAALVHESTYPSQKEEYTNCMVELLDAGRSITGMEHQRLLGRRNDFSRKLQTVFDDIDAIVMPVLAFPPPTNERMQSIDDEIVAGVHRFTCPFNMSGNPALTMPCGQTHDNLPIVFQLVGPRFSEDRLFTAGHAFQGATEFHKTHPIP